MSGFIAPFPRQLSRLYHAVSSCAYAAPRHFSAAAMAAPSVLVTFDIDGTLLGARGKKGNSAHKRAIDDAVEKVYGVSVKVNDIPHAGSTDFAIIRDMCAVGGVSDAVIWEKMSAAVEDASARMEGYVEGSLEALVLPGVREALGELKKRGVHVALTTGNLETCAWVKMRAAGLSDFFTTGGFGSDCLERTDILKKAIERVRALPGNQFETKAHPVVEGKFENVFHVGDAASDMMAARLAGSNGIGVLTGAFSEAQLMAEKPLRVLEDLSDTKHFLSLVGIHDYSN